MLFIVYAQILTDSLAVDKNFVYSMLNLLHALDFCLNWITKTCQTTNQDPQYEMNVLILFFSFSHLDGAVQQMHSSVRPAKYINVNCQHIHQVHWCMC